MASNGDNWAAAPERLHDRGPQPERRWPPERRRVGDLPGHGHAVDGRGDLLAEPRASAAGLRRPDRGRPASPGGGAACAASLADAQAHRDSHAQADPHRASNADAVAAGVPAAASRLCCHRCRASSRRRRRRPPQRPASASHRPVPAQSSSARPSPSPTPLPGGSVATPTPAAGAGGRSSPVAAPRLARDPGPIGVGSGTLTVLDGFGTWAVPAAGCRRAGPAGRPVGGAADGRARWRGFRPCGACAETKTARRRREAR